ncbi:MAG: hypothetical protein ACLURV_08935 [Gallintestinimicrobium sp.]
MPRTENASKRWEDNETQLFVKSFMISRAGMWMRIREKAVRKDQTVFHIFLRQGSDIDRGMEDTKQNAPGRAVPFVQDGMHL